MYVYLQSESNLYTTGFYDPNGQWHAESDHETEDAAARRVHYLNGGNYDVLEMRINEIEARFEDSRPCN